jgi:tRNA1(Val) A37 N6-methylase TrmN6
MSASAPAPAPEITDDTLLGGRVKIRQPRAGYRAAVDPVLLAAAVRAEGGARVLDAGCGTGAVMLCLAARLPAVDVTGLEVQPALAALAEDGVRLNGLTARARVVRGDLTQLPDLVCASAFDVVVTNPPYGADGTVSPTASVATAHHEGAGGLAAWLAACLNLLKPKGRLVLIHRAERLSDVLAALAPSCGDIRVLPVFAKADAPARRVIVDAGKGRNTGDTIHPGLILHAADGRYTAAATAVLRDMQQLAL